MENAMKFVIAFVMAILWAFTAYIVVEAVNVTWPNLPMPALLMAGVTWGMVFSHYLQKAQAPKQGA